jgi:hypothetical protein
MGSALTLIIDTSSIDTMLTMVNCLASIFRQSPCVAMLIT